MARPFEATRYKPSTAPGKIVVRPRRYSGIISRVYVVWSEQKKGLLIAVCRWLFIAILLRRGPLSAEPIPVRYPEGTMHGFLALRTLEGKLLASGELIEVLRGNDVVSHLVFRFKDGSVDDDTAVFSQRGTFRLISDHHVQKGPSFSRPTNVLINASTGQVTVRYQDKDREKVEIDHLDLPADLANGIFLNASRTSRLIQRRRKCLI
jgi:hypothetical protein